MRTELLAALAAVILAAGAARADADDPALSPLADEKGVLTEAALEALLAPAEFADRLFTFTIAGEEAQFCLDVSADGQEVRAELAPSRARWPKKGGVAVVARGEGLALTPVGGAVRAEALERDVIVRWVLRPLGQVFVPRPAFEVAVVEAQVLAGRDGAALFEYRAAASPPRCRDGVEDGAPRCVLGGVGREARALAIDPEGRRLAVAMGGLKPRVEVYALSNDIRLAWTALYPASAGGVVEVAFSTDGRWVVALTGDGRIHRFDAAAGGLHLAIPSSGRAARSLPPGRAVLVAGSGGEVTLWNLADGTISWRLPPRDLRGPVDRLAASGDGARFATLEYDPSRTVVRVWDTGRRAMVAQIEVDPYAVADVALDGDGSRVFVSHEKDGLLAVDVATGGERAAPRKLGGETGARCRGRLQWLASASVLSCAVEEGVIELSADGRLHAELAAGSEASDWIVSAARDGAHTAAVGGGVLLVWIDEGGTAGGTDGKRAGR
ncbi:MAG: PQQ-binding-like beta-propeller repeat protein [Proteobacteria bacterium]|jgi:hypothetical protein|nr:PQQ-binding-like beta-propeller repeat protein [Pseudomonadota bacterium]